MNLSSDSEMGPLRQNQIHRTVRSVHVCALHCAQLLRTIAQKRPDSFPSYPRDNHHCSDNVYLREGTRQQYTQEPAQCTSAVTREK